MRLLSKLIGNERIDSSIYLINIMEPLIRIIVTNVGKNLIIKDGKPS